MTPTSDPLSTTTDRARGRAVVVRIGALGDLLLTRRLAFSLSLAGFESTLLAPARHASVLLGDPWIHAVLDSESARFAPVFSGSWPRAEGEFDLAVVVSNSRDLNEAMGQAAARAVRIRPESQGDRTSIALQWATGAAAVCEPFAGPLPCLKTSPKRAQVTGATFIHPGSGSPAKNWPIDRFAELGRRLGGSGHDVTWIRGPAEAGLPGDLFSGRVLDTPPLDVLAAALARANLFIGNDSGVSHLAAATGAPTIALFGPTLPAVWRPDGPSVSALRAPSGALEDISLEQVLEAAGDLTRLRPTV